MSKEFIQTKKLTCPYCEQEDNGAEEMMDMDQTVQYECGYCGKDFWAKKNYSVTFTSMEL